MSLAEEAMLLRRVIFLILTYGSVLILAETADFKIVEISQGPMRGFRATEGDFFVFYNIPYATAPQGKDKFKAPLPPPTWTSIRDAIDEKIVCPQFDAVNILPNRTTTPDCLIANIYVPDTEETNLPVLVSVHGGGYQIGYGDMITPKHLVQSKKVIVVNFNYRLGAHGFLCLGTPDVPGNAGMKDQVALLKWIKKNIANFGGNPNDVTINGYSAGSASVDLLLLSNSARGLFHKAIPESGANLGSWAVQNDPIATAKEFAKNYHDFVKEDLKDLEEFFKGLSFDSLIKYDMFARLDINFIFAPCVERDLGEERFLHDAPEHILKSGNFSKVPMLYGFSNMEGLSRLGINYEAIEKAMNEKFTDFLPHDLQFKNDEEREEIGRKVKEFYFKGKPIGEETVLGFIDYHTDIMYSYSTLKSARLQAQAGNDKVFLYEFSFADSDAPMPPQLNKTKVRGANHCAQTMMVLDGLGQFGVPTDESVLSDDVKKMKAIVRELWINFITTGTPTPPGSSLPPWRATDRSLSAHMSLNLTPELKGPLLLARVQLWDVIYDKHYRPPSPPAKPKIHNEL